MGNTRYTFPNGNWLECGFSLLERNEIQLLCFSNAIYKALSLSCGKYQNVYVYGQANSSKTFILKPLQSIYNAFTNPAAGTFAWLGVGNAEVVLLNDFHWNPSIIAWDDFLQLLEGDMPFFATAYASIVLVKRGCLDQCNM